MVLKRALRRGKLSSATRSNAIASQRWRKILDVIRCALEAAGVELIDENGGGFYNFRVFATQKYAFADRSSVLLVFGQ